MNKKFFVFFINSSYANTDSETHTTVLSATTEKHDVFIPKTDLLVQLKCNYVKKEIIFFLCKQLTFLLRNNSGFMQILVTQKMTANDFIIFIFIQTASSKQWKIIKDFKKNHS